VGLAARKDGRKEGGILFALHLGKVSVTPIDRIRIVGYGVPLATENLIVHLKGAISDAESD
jgi:hypothetical protein